MRTKNLPLAVGLNLALPGLGYMYMGAWLVGLLALPCVVLVYGFGVMMSPAFLVIWLAINAIMALDMLALDHRRRRKHDKRHMTDCPACAERVRKKAHICRFCGHDLDQADGSDQEPVKRARGV